MWKHNRRLITNELETKKNKVKIISIAFRCSLQCLISMNLVFHISEDGSEIVSNSVNKYTNCRALNT